jgi:hypothetical protein
MAVDIKETNRRLQSLDEYTTGEIKRLSEEITANKNALKGLQKKVGDLERSSQRSESRLDFCKGKVVC